MLFFERDFMFNTHVSLIFQTSSDFTSNKQERGSAAENNFYRSVTSGYNIEFYQ